MVPLLPARRLRGLPRRAEERSGPAGSSRCRAPTADAGRRAPPCGAVPRAPPHPSSQVAASVPMANKAPDFATEINPAAPLARPPTSGACSPSARCTRALGGNIRYLISGGAAPEDTRRTLRGPRLRASSLKATASPRPRRCLTVAKAGLARRPGRQGHPGRHHREDRLARREHGVGEGPRPRPQRQRLRLHDIEGATSDVPRRGRLAPHRRPSAS
jgi:hypothetical protein